MISTRFLYPSHLASVHVSVNVTYRACWAFAQFAEMDFTSNYALQQGVASVVEVRHWGIQAVSLSHAFVQHVSLSVPMSDARNCCCSLLHSSVVVPVTVYVRLGNPCEVHGWVLLPFHLAE